MQNGRSDKRRIENIRFSAFFSLKKKQFIFFRGHLRRLTPRKPFPRKFQSKNRILGWPDTRNHMSKGYYINMGFSSTRTNTILLGFYSCSKIYWFMKEKHHTHQPSNQQLVACNSRLCLLFPTVLFTNQFGSKHKDTWKKTLFCNTNICSEVLSRILHGQ